MEKHTVKCASISFMLIFSIFSSLMGSLQVGFHMGNMEHALLEEFYMNLWKQHHVIEMPSNVFNFLVTITPSVLELGAAISSFFVPLLANHCGRRISIFIINIFTATAVGLIYVSKVNGNIVYLTVGRFVMGIYCGLAMSLIPLYIHELSPASLQNSLCTLSHFFHGIGIFIGEIICMKNALSTQMWWSVLLITTSVIAGLQLFTLPFCSKSPPYLYVVCKKEEEAKLELQRLRGTEDVQKELEMIKEEAAHHEKGFTLCKIFTVPSYRKAIIIALVINAATQLSGIIMLNKESTEMFHQAGVTFSEELTLGIRIMNLLFIILAALLVKFCGWRFLLIAGQVPMALANTLLFTSESTIADFSWMKYVIVCSIYLFMISYDLGPGPISWYVAEDIFNHEARPFATGVTSTWLWSIRLLWTFFHIKIVNFLGPNIFLIFAFILVMATVYTWINTREPTSEESDLV